MKTATKFTTKTTASALALLASVSLTSPSIYAGEPAMQAAPASFAPLSPEDAAALVDASLANVAGVTAPELGDVESSAARGVEVDLRTGAEAETPEAIEPDGAAAAADPSIPGFEGLCKGGGTTQIVVGADGRTLVDDTTAFPYRAVCRVFATFGDGATFSGTATMVSAKHAITAGHCIYSAEHGGWAKTVKVVPALDGAYAPFGELQALKMRAFMNFTTGKDAAFDLALLTLSADVGTTTGWFGVGKAGRLANKELRLSGYPTDIDSGAQMYTGTGVAASADLKFVSHPIDSGAGQTGGALTRVAKGQTYVTAIHIGAAGGTNRGVLMNGDRLKYVKEWIASGE